MALSKTISISAMFETLRNRDAWGTIRGFVYQVDLTILRWLSLSDSELLELERGEDIDLVGRAIGSSDEQEQERLLNQVKVRGSRLSLRSPEAIAAIASFVEHRQANPTLKLFFRYTTNAEVATERPAAFENGESAIRVWMQVNRGKTDKAHVIAEKIRLFLLNQKRPGKLNPDTWDRCVSFLKSATSRDVLDIIASFEWETGQSSTENIGDKLKKILIETGYASSPEEAEEIYRRLFLYVFLLLTQKSTKTLEKKELLTEVKRPRLNTYQQELLTRMESLHDELAKKVKQHEQRIERNSSDIIKLQNAALGTSKVHAEFINGRTVPSIQVPPSVNHAIGRENTVDDLMESLFQKTWLALHGSSGTGKTQLAILVAQKHSSCMAWLRLQSDVEIAPFALNRLEQSLEVASGCSRAPDRTKWYAELCATWPKGSLIVIDDMPRLVQNTPFSEAMILLVRACKSCGIKIVTTSPFSLPETFVLDIGHGLVSDVSMPLLTDDEALKILVTHGAPPEIIIKSRVTFLNNVCRTHPTLLIAAIRFLQNREWRFSEQEFGDLLSGKHGENIKSETLSKVLDTVPHPQSRELLERLTLVIHRFGIKEIHATAAVPPQVERPMDHLNSLLGLWIQQEINEQFLVSPLAKNLGAVNLSEERKQQVYCALGNNVLQRKKLNQSDASDAVLYFASAQEWNIAGQVFLMSLQAMLEKGIPDYDSGLLSMWSEPEVPLPREMALGLRLMIRATQISLSIETQKPHENLLKNLDELIAEGDQNNAPTIFASTLATGNALAGSDSVMSCRYLTIGIQQLPLFIHRPEFSEIWPDIPVGQFVWVAAMGVSTLEGLSAWIELLKTLSPEQLSGMMTSENMDIGCKYVSDSIWCAEVEKPAELRDWDSVMESLESLATVAKDLQLELLWASAIQAQIMLLTDYQDDFQRALQMAKCALEDIEGDCSKFLLLDCIGRQFFYKRDFSRAREWFTQAEAIEINEFSLLRLQSLVHASVALELNFPEQAANYLEKALALGKTDESIPVTELIKVLGEFCVLRGLNGDLSGAYTAIDEAFTCLWEVKDDSNEWKALLTLLGHLTGYFSSMATTGQPPEVEIEGTPYSMPIRGMFLQFNEPACAKLCNDEKMSFIFVPLAQFADALGNADRASYWALKGLDAAYATGGTMAISVLSTQVVPALILQAKHAEAIALMVDATIISAAGMAERRDGRQPQMVDMDVKTILGSKPNEAWNQAEAESIKFGLLPVVCELAREKLESPDSARNHAADVLSACRQLSQTGSHRDLWNYAADVVEKGFLKETSPNALIKIAEKLDPEIYGWLRAVAYLCANVQAGVRLEDTCRLQLMLMPLALKDIRACSRMTYDLILLPWLTETWRKLFENQRFRFSSPARVEEDLKVAISLSEDVQAQAVLKAIIRGLNLPINEENRKWINSIASN